MLERITIEIKCENEAFTDDPQQEIARILSNLADAIGDGAAQGGKRLMDYNGNRVGEYNEWED